jgi:hypothetical protein
MTQMVMMMVMMYLTMQEAEIRNPACHQSLALAVEQFATQAGC